MSKRLIPAPLEATEIERGVVVSTHDHQDHLDEESITNIARNAPQVQFGGPISCVRALERIGIPPERTHRLAVGEACSFDGFSLRAVYADHGESEPDAIGIVLDADGIRVYHTGDTCYCPERMGEVIDLKPDVIMPCINGTFGNLDGIEGVPTGQRCGCKSGYPFPLLVLYRSKHQPDGHAGGLSGNVRTDAPQVTPVILTVAEAYVFSRE